MRALPAFDKSAPRTPADKLWIAFRFIVFGIGGFLLIWVSMLSLAMEFSSPKEHWMSPYLALALAFVATLMMLLGVGEWGRWGYLLVLISSPLVAFLSFTIPWPKWFDDIMNTGSFILLLALPFIFTYVLVRRYYRRRDAKANSALNENLPGPIPEEQTAK